MTDKTIKEIDYILNRVIPDDPTSVSETVAEDRRQEFIRILQYAADQLGHSPSARDFNSLSLNTSARTIQKVFGSWNKAKQEAGLETYEVGESKSGYVNQDYFSEIDSSEKSYWLGTLFSSSALHKADQNSQLTLVIGRAGEKRFFAEGLAEATDSQYAIPVYENKQTGNVQVSLTISDQEFIRNVLDQGYPKIDEEARNFPSLDQEYRPAFIRGYIEAGRRKFSGSPIRIRMENEARAETFRDWLNEVGLSRPTITERASDGIGINITNSFEIKALFEGLYPEGVSTEPSYTPYPEGILDYLEEEYPYPDNVEYLSD